MLDELLGRAELKDRIAELEEEKRHLERRAEAETERRSEAARKRQDAEAEVNRLETRVEELEDRVERLSADGETEVEFRRSEPLRGDRLDEVLSRLESLATGPEGSLSAMVEETPPESVTAALGDRAALVRRAAPCLVYTDDAGLVSVALEPPTPPAAFDEWGSGFRLDRSWFRPEGSVAVALVRSDLFALGRFDGESVTLVDEVETNVMNAHSKGGFSQARFERRRDEQVATHVDRSKEVLRAHSGAGAGEGDESEAEELVVLGERTVLGEFEEFADHRGTVDASGEPEQALREAVREFWTTRLSVV